MGQASKLSHARRCAAGFAGGMSLVAVGRGWLGENPEEAGFNFHNLQGVHLRKCLLAVGVMSLHSCSQVTSDAQMRNGHG